MGELKPCPFCGGKAETSRGLHKYDYWGVWCPKCEVRTGLYASEREAIKAWNTRYERTCNIVPIPYREMVVGHEYKCSVCGYPMTDHDSYCSECGARRV